MIKRLIENQRLLQAEVNKHGYVYKDTTDIVEKYIEWIRDESVEALQETTLSTIDDDALNEEISDVFIFLLDMCIRLQNERDIFNIAPQRQIEELKATLPITCTDLNKSKILEEFVLDIAIKTSNVRKQVNCKVWKRPKEINQKELNDKIHLVLISWLTLCINLGIENEIFDTMLKKQQINVDRQLGLVKGREDYKA